MSQLAGTEWALLVVASILVGFGKTALPGLVTLSVAIFAGILPARESTAVLLLLLLIGDLVAVKVYLLHTDWRALGKLIPSVLGGIAAGALFLAAVNDCVMRRSVGVILVTITIATIYMMKRPSLAISAQRSPKSRARLFYGFLGGFTTMSANSGGPVMSLYFLSSGFNMHRFLGTQAWFFFIVNVIKLPFSISMGLVNAHVIQLFATLAPIVFFSALLGKRLTDSMSEHVFENIILLLTLGSSTYLIFS